MVHIEYRTEISGEPGHGSVSTDSVKRHLYKLELSHVY